MTYIHYFGIDISKKTFDIAFINASTEQTADNKTMQSMKHVSYPNDSQGIKSFLKAFKAYLDQSYFVMEATGGYETLLLSSLTEQGLAVHVADPLSAKYFIKSLGKKAKTDALDSMALARYGQERHGELRLAPKEDKAQQRLKQLNSRYDDLVKMRTQERQRLQHPNYEGMQTSVLHILKVVEKEIAAIEKQMQEIIQSNEVMRDKNLIMQKFKGVGIKTALAILAFMPEIGTLDRRRAASLAGCAPHPRDSGATNHYRHTHYGRANLKKALFMAALSAIRYNETCRLFFNNLIQRGKKPMVAIVAVMRKMITTLNAQIRDNIIVQQHGR